MIASLAGCATMQPPWTTTAAPGQAESVPMVQNCTVFNVSTPTRFACNGKVYTTYQLAKARMEAEKKYESGK